MKKPLCTRRLLQRPPRDRLVVGAAPGENAAAIGAVVVVEMPRTVVVDGEVERAVAVVVERRGRSGRRAGIDRRGDRTGREVVAHPGPRVEDHRRFDAVADVVARYRHEPGDVADPDALVV